MGIGGIPRFPQDASGVIGAIPVPRRLGRLLAVTLLVLELEELLIVLLVLLLTPALLVVLAPFDIAVPAPPADMS
jgi:hypothetical protein